MVPEHISIGNRRYTGSKRALLQDIYESIKPYQTQGAVFADFFAGTGAVSLFMLQKGMRVIVNDLLRSNYIVYDAWFGDGVFDIEKLKTLVAYCNNVSGESLSSNYFSETYGGTYFSDTDAKKIGYIREYLEEAQLTEREKNILLTSLLYATDKIANTVGHFEHFLAKTPVDKGVFLRLPDIQPFSGMATVYNEDANVLARKIECDIAYIDPPYNARQYINFYHVLENLVRWEKPTEFEGASMKFKRDFLKSAYSKKQAPEVFQDLLSVLRARVIVVSYNNTYSAKSSASNNKITEAQMLAMLSAKGTVTKKEIQHKSFNSGKTNFVDHKEILYTCITSI